MSSKKIGVLLPQSKEFPTMGKEFINGLKLSLFQNDYNFIVEGIGFGNNTEQITNSIQKLINQEDVDITTGILGHKGLTTILDFVEGMEEPFLYSDFGATKPLDLSNRKNIYCNSLDLYKATSLLGQYFLNNNLLNIGTSTCYYESGYGFLEAIQNSIYKNKKGQFSGHFITPLHPRENEADLMKEFVSATNPDALFAFHNGIYAKEHASYLQNNEINKSTPLYTLPFTIDNKILQQFPKIFDQTRCVSSWFTNSKNEENQNFTSLYKERYNKTPSIFSVLGYENGLLIKNFLGNINNFSNAEIIGPRGPLNVNKTTNRTDIKQLLWELSWDGNTYKIKCLEELDYQMAIDFLNSDQDNGWHNAYLCH